MNLNVTSLLSRLALEQDEKLSALLSAAATESKKSGDPLALRDPHKISANKPTPYYGSF